ncbi:MAG: SDR family NAD(P)-dependent oxidoreductase [Candidatus Kapabacteria bacterium]|nr:SDR family NAD(P)-dependent oxidoreductase [Candidatus Kapabacteria bacterium]
MNPSSIVIIGATSGIAQGVARHYAQRGWNIYLVARNTDALAAIQSDLLARGAMKVESMAADLRDVSRHDEVVKGAQQFSETIGVVLIAHGILRNQLEIDYDADEMLQVWNVNATSSISLLHRFGVAMETQRSGTIAIISSVAGDRGRRSLYTYGSTKAAVSHFVAGMRGRYKPLGINVLDIKPGPVDTPMMTGRTLMLGATVETVAKDIVAAIDKRKGVLYTPWFWRVIMRIVRMIPEPIFLKIKF